MVREFSPDGYISIYEAIRRAAKIQDYTDADDVWRDFGDLLNDAEALDRATTKLRQWLCDGALIAYTPGGSGNKTKVPKWTWTDDSACLSDRSPDEQFHDFQIFSGKGIKLEDRWLPVFVSEKRFKSLLGEDEDVAKSNKVNVKRGPGRPKGSGSFDDEQWLERMEIQVLKGLGVLEAANDVVAVFKKDIRRKRGIVNDESIAHRLYQKYKKSNRPQKNPPHLTDRN